MAQPQTEKTSEKIEVLIDIDSSFKLVHIRIASQDVLTTVAISNILANISGKLNEEPRKEERSAEGSDGSDSYCGAV